VQGKADDMQVPGLKLYLVMPKYSEGDLHASLLRLHEEAAQTAGRGSRREINLISIVTIMIQVSPMTVMPRCLFVIALCVVIGLQQASDFTSHQLLPSQWLGVCQPVHVRIIWVQHSQPALSDPT
jgi:hypothetical protein